MAVLLPYGSVAAEAGHTDDPVTGRHKAGMLWFQDSVSVKRKPVNRQPAPAERHPREEQDDRIRNIERRSIKQVPRSAPKLKPQPVPDGVKIRRSPPPGM